MTEHSQSETSAMEAWKARGRELNEAYDAIARTVRAFGMQPTPNDPLADLARLERERDRYREALVLIADTDPIDAALDPDRALRVARGRRSMAEGQSVCPRVGVNAWGWEPWGLPFAAGMALHSMDDERHPWWSLPTLGEQAAHERRHPQNPFTMNAREADRLVLLHRLARAMPCHDRPERFARLSGAYGRPAGAFTQPHALWAMEARDA